ncbi:MAG TPA: class I SAM-dependent methyltransferase [Woeseiaceae bacterium]|nr:class I SAM-dependent methyltransferase [Woeseiaceae bacterium]
MPTPSTPPADLLACPRCDKTPLEPGAVGHRCAACRVDFPAVGGIPWLFAEPAAALADWRGRAHAADERLRHESAMLDAELAGDSLGTAARARLLRYRGLVERQRGALAALLQPLGAEPRSARHESYLALRTRLPTDQGLNTYYANVHRDWAWGGEENAASLAAISTVLDATGFDPNGFDPNGFGPNGFDPNGFGPNGFDPNGLGPNGLGPNGLGHVAVLGAGAGRLAYDCHRAFPTTSLTVLDFNPLLALVAAKMFAGETLAMVEFPLAPLGEEDDAVLRELSAPAPAGDGLYVVLGDALRAPFAAGRFDTVLTPWLIDIVDDTLPAFAARVNRLLKPGGRWVNFGSLAFAGPARAGRHTPREVAGILTENGFAEPVSHDTTMPYMCSPASRHGRRETVFTFAARKSGDARDPGRHRALPDWLVTGKGPVPLSPGIRTQVLSTQIHAFVMGLIDGRRSIHDMARLLEERHLMTSEEAVPAIRNFFIRMVEDARKGV